MDAAEEPATAPQTGKKTSTKTAAKGGKSPQKEPSPLQKEQSIVVEMTPHDRAKYHNGKWTHDLLESIKGRQVKVVGQAFTGYTNHMELKDICRLRCRANKLLAPLSLELHPVTEFYVCKSDSCTEDSPDWVALDGAPAQGIGKR